MCVNFWYVVVLKSHVTSLTHLHPICHTRLEKNFSKDCPTFNTLHSFVRFKRLKKLCNNFTECFLRCDLIDWHKLVFRELSELHSEPNITLMLCFNSEEAPWKAAVKDWINFPGSLGVCVPKKFLGMFCRPSYDWHQLVWRLVHKYGRNVIMWKFTFILVWFLGQFRSALRP